MRALEACLHRRLPAAGFQRPHPVTPATSGRTRPRARRSMRKSWRNDDPRASRPTSLRQQSPMTTRAVCKSPPAS